MKALPLLSAVTLVAGLLPTTHAAWQRLPSQPKRPVEIAVGSLQDTRLESSNRIEKPTALISDEVTLVATLPKGKSDAVITLGSQAIVDRASFHNLGGEGKFTVSASPDNSQWTQLGQTVFTSADVHVIVSFAAAQTRYVKVEFDLLHEAEARHLELFGRLPNNQDYKHGHITNLATSLAGARIIYMHPSPTSGTDPTSNFGYFDFPDSDEKFRTVIYDLGGVKKVSEFGSVHSTRPVRFEVFVFSELPEQEDWRGRRTFDPEVLSTSKPLVSYEDRSGTGYLRVKAPQPVEARYVAMRWEPDFNPPAFVVVGIEIIAQFPQNLSPFAGGGGYGGQASGMPTGFVGAFVPNSLMGAGSAGLPFFSGGGGGGGGGGAGGGGGGGGGGPPDVDPPSPP